jgi:hypothetical protein
MKKPDRLIPHRILLFMMHQESVVIEDRSRKGSLFEIRIEPRITSLCGQIYQSVPHPESRGFGLQTGPAELLGGALLDDERCVPLSKSAAGSLRGWSTALLGLAPCG